MVVSTAVGVIGRVTESVGNSGKERELKASVWAHYFGSYDILEKPLSAHFYSLLPSPWRAANDYTHGENILSPFSKP